MPPLILHNVPDEELYVGEDGIQRPYAMLFPGNENSPSLSRTRRAVAETGSFGKSTRRSRSRTGTPAAKREDPTIEAATAVFSNFLSSRVAHSTDNQRNTGLTASVSQPNLSASTSNNDENGRTPSRYVHKEPTEVILRGFKESHQYAAIREYERIGGRICEDYDREPPIEQRRYKSDMRDTAAMRTQPLTAEERIKANTWAGGANWIKITFESAQGAEAAVDASPQTIQGFLVYAEPYRGVPPTNRDAVPAGFQRPQSLGTTGGQHFYNAQRQTSTLPRSHTTPALPQMSEIGRGHKTISPTASQTSSQTLDTTTLSSATSSSATVVGQPLSQSPAQTTSFTPSNDPSQIFCRKIPTAKRLQLLPAEQALLPQQSRTQRVLAQLPLLNWLTTDMIGTAVPRVEGTGEFDYARASLYWVFIYWLDVLLFGIFEVSTPDKGE